MEGRGALPRAEVDGYAQRELALQLTWEHPQDRKEEVNVRAARSSVKCCELSGATFPAPQIEERGSVAPPTSRQLRSTILIQTFDSAHCRRRARATRPQSSLPTCGNAARLQQWSTSPRDDNCRRHCGLNRSAIRSNGETHVLIRRLAV